jgi:hypothetical protein
MTTNTATAQIRWLSEDEGGRKILPSGLRYVTVARFLDIADRWPEVAWSLVVEFDELPHPEAMTAIIRFLAPTGPSELLYRGSRFELFEGGRIVAQGEVM